MAHIIYWLQCSLSVSLVANVLEHEGNIRETDFTPKQIIMIVL